MAKRSKKYTDEFKRDAVRLMRNRGKRTVAQIADDLGVTDGMLYRRADKLGKASTAKRNVQGNLLSKRIVVFARRTSSYVSPCVREVAASPEVTQGRVTNQWGGWRWQCLDRIRSDSSHRW